MAGFFLYVSNTTLKENGYLCFHEIQTVAGTPAEDQTITCSVHGRYIIYYNERRQDVVYPSYYSQYAYNELCEVEVYGEYHTNIRNVVKKIDISMIIKDALITENIS